MLQNNEKSAEVLKAEKIVEQAKARLAEAKRKASQQKRKEDEYSVASEPLNPLQRAIHSE